jgi:hypothetical protein
VAVLVALLLSSAACNASVASPSPSPAATATLPSPAPSDAAVPPATAPSLLPSVVVGAVTVDPTLLAILPTTVAGLPVDAIAKPAGIDDPVLAETVERMAQSFVIDPATDDFAYGSVIALRPGVYSTPFYRSWRDSFDEGACSQSGGVASHAETKIAGRTVFMGRCDGGVTTYHVYLEGSNEIVSISALGEHRFGEQLLAGLKP